MKPRFFPLRACFVPSILVSIAPVALSAPLYWTDANGNDNWGTSTNWSASSDGSTAGAVPVLADDVIFNISSLNSDQLILLNAARSANSFTFRSAGATSIQGGGSSRDLTVGAGGIAIDAGAGAVTIGSSTPGFGAATKIATDQTWTNNSSNMFTVVNSVQSTATSGIQALTIAGSGNTTLNSAVSNGSAGGQVALTKTGGGTLTVNANNAYTGVTTISGGIFQVSNLANGGAASSIGQAGVEAANLVIDGGTLQWTGAANDSTDRGFTIGASGATIDNTNTAALLRFGGVATGGGSLTKTGAGTLALSGLSDYTGKTFVNGGNLDIRTAEALGASGTAANGTEVAAGALLTLNPGTTGGTMADTIWTEWLTLNGGTVRNASRNNQWNGEVSLTADSTFAANTSTVLTVGGVVGGSGGINKTEAGTVYFTGSNTYTGVTTITSGTLRVNTLANGGAASGIGSSSGASSNLVFDGGTLWLSSGSDVGIDRGFTLNAAGGTIRKDSGILRFGGVVTGAGELRKSGSGVLALSNVGNNYTGRTVVTGGTLEARRAEALGASGSEVNGTVVNANATLRLDPDGTGGSAVDSTWNETLLLNGGTLSNRRRNNVWQGSVVLQANSVISADASTSLTISSAISEEAGSFGFTKGGDGTVISTGTNTFTGATNVTGGVLEAAATGGFNSSTALNLAAGTFRLGANQVFNDAAAVSFGAGGILQANGFSEILGVVAVNGAGTVDLDAASGIIRFGNSSGQAWSDLLSISGWDGLAAGGGSEQLFFGDDGTGLNSSQLSMIRFIDPEGFAAGIYDAAMLATGEIVPGSLIPEPSVLLLGLLGGVGALARRKR